MGVLSGARSDTRTQAADGTWSVTRQNNWPTGLPSAGITYSLNIAIAARTVNEVRARPTILALDGKASNFLSGTQISVPISNSYSNNLQDKAVATSLSVTLTMIDDDSLMLSAKASVSCLRPNDAGTIKESIVTLKNAVRANVRMRYGQTLIFSGLLESDGTRSHSGVPVLQDIPGVQYAFLHRDDQVTRQGRSHSGHLAQGGERR